MKRYLALFMALIFLLSAIGLTSCGSGNEKVTEKPEKNTTEEKSELSDERTTEKRQESTEKGEVTTSSAPSETPTEETTFAVKVRPSKSAILEMARVKMLL